MLPEPTPTHSRLTKYRLLLLFAAPLVILAVAWGTPLALFSARKTATTTAVKPIDGIAVFQQNCAQCHGADGDGRGSTILNPPARYFGRDKFKFASTANGIPTDDDLMHVMRHGIPGSAMPNFVNVCDEECQACIEQIRRFTRQGLYQRQVEKALKNDDDIEPAKFSQMAAKMSVPEAKLEIPAIPPATFDSVQRGKLVYAKLCSSCHGPEGKGDGAQVVELRKLLAEIHDLQGQSNDPEKLKGKLKLLEPYQKGEWLQSNGTPNYPRDLTLGQYKAGGEPEQLYARIMLGIPGTPMPSSANQPQADIFDLIHFVQTLAKN
jgi:mono/diheme cytochrome c family protein